MMPINILIVDDNKEILDFLTELFEFENFTVHAYQHTKNIFSLISEHEPNLIILDYLIDGLNGGELCAEIKSSHKTMNTPVILLSAYDRIISSLGDYGCDAFISKPFDNKELIEKVFELLKLN